MLKPGREPHPWFKWGPVFVGTLFSGAVLHAQEALNSALSYDQVLRQQNNVPELPPDTPHIGPVPFTMGAYAGLQLDDNINLSQSHPESDTIISAGLNLNFVWPATAQSELNFNTQIGYATYLNHSGYNYLEIAPGSALTWAFSLKDTTVTFYDQTSAAQETLSAGAVSNSGRIPRFENTAGLRIAWQPGQWDLEGGYSRDLYYSPNAAYAYLDRSSDYYFTRAAWCFATASQLGVEASVSTTSYDQASQSGNVSYSLGPYLQWQMTPYLSASLRGGPTIYVFDGTAGGAPGSTLTSYYVGLDVSDQLTDFLSQQLSLQRSVNVGYGMGYNYTEQYSANYYLHWAATDWLGINLSLTYENGQQPLEEAFGPFIFFTNEKYSRYGFSPGLSYQLTKNINLTLNYSWWKRLSNLGGNNYEDNSVSLQFQYAF